MRVRRASEAPGRKGAHCRACLMRGSGLTPSVSTTYSASQRVHKGGGRQVGGAAGGHAALGSDCACVVSRTWCKAGGLCARRRTAQDTCTEWPSREHLPVAMPGKAAKAAAALCCTRGKGAAGSRGCVLICFLYNSTAGQRAASLTCAGLVHDARDAPSVSAPPGLGGAGGVGQRAAIRHLRVSMQHASGSTARQG